MKIRDRISGTVVSRPPESVVFGQWEIAPDTGGSSLLLNDFPAEEGDALVPDPTGQWTLASLPGVPEAKGRFYRDALPDDQDANALLQLGSLLEDLVQKEAGWLEWCGWSPLAPGLEDAAKRHALESRIEEELPHLEAVCRRPRTHIRLETERVLVSRARRIDRRAPAWLAAHTEDWEHRKISGIEPRRILSQVREEEWDLYENRVTARLVDNLVAWLRRRISEVRRIRDDLLARLAKFEVSAGGNIHLRNRIFSLWGEAWAGDQGKEVLDLVIKALEQLLYRILGLMDSTLYRNVPRGAQVTRSLLATNLFTNDAHYRGVARLWNEWSHNAISHVRSPQQLHQEYQKLRRGFDAWCMLMMVRACSQLGMEPVDEHLETPIRPGGPTIPLVTGHAIQWDRDGTLAILDGERTCVHFVPIIHVLEATNTSGPSDDRMEQLVQSAAGNSAWTIVLHPALPGDTKKKELASVGNPPFPETMGAIDFVRVSPFLLDSVERAARAVRWATLAPRMLSYPPIVSRPPEELLPQSGQWLELRNRSEAALLSTLQPHERISLGTENRLAEARISRDRLLASRQQIDSELRQVRGNDPRRLRQLNLERRALLKDLDVTETRVESLERFSTLLENAERKIKALSRCPVCGSESDLRPRSGDCFEARCEAKDGCGTRWELRIHQQTRQRYPALLPGGIRPLDWPRQESPQWVDEVLGCDVLSVPVADAAGDVVFLLPRTSIR